MRRLKSLELLGYKTFATKTTFEFAGTITAIVGPNGSGKSNIADAIRWVLGEQSFSLLRGRKTVDMIFSGSEQRPRAGMAAATLTFDNGDRWLPIEFSEVAVTRRAYRDGQNEYLLNGQRVRLRDISELLGTAGLAERTYTIVGQGLIDASLSLKADERRKLFEEAAGIGLYRARREEALRRLDATQRNLERVQDILSELKPRLRSLERQAGRAREYEQVKTDLHAMLREWYGYHWHQAQKELKEARDFAARREAELEASRKKQAELEEHLATLQENLSQARERLNDWRSQATQVQARRDALSRDLAVSAERRRALEERQAVLGRVLATLREERALLQGQLAEAEAEARTLQAQLAEARRNAEETQAEMDRIQVERRSLEHALEQTRQQISQLAARGEVLAARRMEWIAGRERHRAALAEAEKSLADLNHALEAARTRQEQEDEQLQGIRRAITQARAAWERSQAEAQSAERDLQTALEAHARTKDEQARLTMQLDVLEKAEAALVGYGEGARRLLEAAREGRLPGARGALVQFLEVPPEYELALTAVLGDFLEGIVLAGGADADAALDLLVESSGRAALLPLDGQRAAEERPRRGAPGFLGLGSEMVSAPPELRSLIETLLGRTWMVRDREAARNLLPDAPGGVRVVTLAGEVFLAEGPIQTGSGGPSGAVGRQRERRELALELERVRGRLARSGERMRELDEERARLREAEGERAAGLRELELEEEAVRARQREAALEVDGIRHQVEWQEMQRRAAAQRLEEAERGLRQVEEEQARIEPELSDKQAHIQTLRERLLGQSLDAHQSRAAYWAAQVELFERMAKDAAVREAERRVASERLEEQIRAHEREMGQVEQERQALEAERAVLTADEGELAGQLAALEALMRPAGAELEALEQGRERLRKSEIEARQSLVQAERLYAQAQLGLARRQEALEALRRRIEEDFGLVAFEYEEEVAGPTPLPFSEMVETLALVTALPPELEEAIKRQRAQLRRIGPVNPEAQREFAEVSERYTFTVQQIADLEKAEADIRRIIRELDELMKRDFLNTYEAVAREFKEIFGRLFGGGSAALLLTEPNDLTNTGVDIEARLPGRRSQELSLLSGGERSLTASALIFALLKVSPTPFCVLDEVDAMLDEANIHRFADLLREFSENTQFIIITHNRNTVQAADTIYGITMGADSTSQVLSLRLDQVAEQLGELAR